MFWIKLMKKNQQPVLNPVDDFKKQARKKSCSNQLIYEFTGKWGLTA